MSSPYSSPTTFPSIRSVRTLACIFVLLYTLSLTCADLHAFEKEYRLLYDDTDDKDALEAIRDLHHQLDDDNDGTIEPSETGDFIKADLQYGSDKSRQKNFHSKDEEITVKDLWIIWKRSEVYNWTVDDVVDWLKNNVDLPQYEEKFRKFNFNGTQLPKAATGSSFLSKVLGITNPIHRSKINLKAMDVVLFGPPRDQSNFVKDTILTTLLIIAVSGLFYAYRQNKRSQDHLKKMMQDMDSLSKAEQTLQELQETLQQKDSKIESLSATPPDWSDGEELGRLREEVNFLRNELQRAEVELEDKCWMAPQVLQHWLQLTYEVENTIYNAKKKAAEEQMEHAKEMCEKLKRKRSSLVGAFVSTHGGSIDDVDKSILEARTALMDLTKDLTERTQRWRQIEMLCGCSIINNPGISILQNLVRHIGTGRGNFSSRTGMSSRMSHSNSQEDLGLILDDDAHSVASSHMTAASQLSRANVNSASLLSTTLKDQHIRRRADLKSLSRESSMDTTSSSDEVSRSPSINRIAATPPMTKKSVIDKRKQRMVKSYSQDEGGSMQEHALNHAHQYSPMLNRAMIGSPGTNSMTSSVSESHLQQQQEKEKLVQTKPPLPPGLSELMESTNALYLSKRSIGGSELSGSDAGSTTSLSSEKKKKKKMFFNFGKKKEKKDVM